MKKLKKKVKLVNITTYCSKAKVYDTQDMIIYFTQMEDKYNHNFVPIKIPDMKYPNLKMSLTSVHAFLSGIRGFTASILP